MGNPLTAAAQNNTTSPVKTKDCKFCGKQGLLIWPLRYAVLGNKNDKCLDGLPAISGQLAAPTVELTNSRYAVRTMCTGYLYVLVERGAAKRWQGYFVTFDGYLSEFPVATPPVVDPNFTCSPDQCGLNASMVAIEKPTEVENAYFLFTPDPLTLPMLKLYSDNAVDYAAAGKMQAFKPKDWVEGKTQQKHSLTTAQIPTMLAELIVEKNSKLPVGKALNEALEDSLHPTLFQGGHWMYVENKKIAGPFVSVIPEAYFETLARKSATTRFTKQHAYLNQQKQFGAAFVINDHIGITQELNDFRNSAFHALEKFMRAEDKYKASNERKLQVMEKIEEIKVGLQKGAILRGENRVKFLQKGIDAELNTLQYPSSIRNNPVEQIKYRESIVKAREAEKEMAIKRAQQEAATIWDKYQAKLDPEENERASLKKSLANLTNNAILAGNQRVNDHLCWIGSSFVLDALDCYDRNDLTSGFCFSHQVSECLHGMAGVPASEKFLTEWVSTLTVDRKNLFMRAYAYNQKELEDHVAEGIKALKPHAEKAHSADDISGALVMKCFKGAFDGFKKADGAWDAWASDRKAVPGFNKTLTGKTFLWMSEFSRTVFRKGTGGKPNKFLAIMFGAFVYPRLGRLTNKFTFENAMLSFKNEHPNLGDKKRSDRRLKELAEKRADEKAGKASSKVKGLQEELLADAQVRAREASEAAIAEANASTATNPIERAKEKIAANEAKAARFSDPDFKPPVNNYHQVRIGCLLATIESIALASKFYDAKDKQEWSNQTKAEVIGSICSLSSIVIDTLYALPKSARELAKNSDKALPLNRAADIVRGELKLASGILSATAGGISAVMDGMKGWDELTKRNTNYVLFSVYFGRSFAGGSGAILTLLSAVSYTGPMFTYMGESLGKKAIIGRFFIWFSKGGFTVAKYFAAGRVSMLIWVARFNLAGFVLTAAEIGIRCFILDDDLENWCDACSFRKDKEGFFSAKPYVTADEELKALDESFNAVM